MWDNSGLGALDWKDGYVEEHIHTEETGVDGEMEVDAINEERKHRWLQRLRLGRARSGKNAE